MPSRPNPSNESFIRWQGRYLEQRQNASSVMLGLSGGALAFSASLISDETCFIGQWPTITFHGVALLQTLSIAAGVFFTINRVRDYGITTQIARVRRLKQQDSLQSLRTEQRRLGKITRGLYSAQASLFLAGALFFIAFCLTRLAPALYGMG
jgi:hypothetical protein